MKHTLMTVIYSSTWSLHIAQVEEVFGRLAAANLTVNLAKCEFGQATVTYLGKVVGRGGSLSYRR